MQLVRITSDATGASHFDEVDVPLAAQAIGMMSAPAPASQYFFLRMPPGQDTGWHPSFARLLVVFLAGEIEVEVSDGTTRRFQPGDLTLAEDTTGTGHLSRSTGREDALMVILQLPS